ncbi:hypothetical protein RJ640_006071 [Escallonia rubra]|uniref:Retrotransposon gag domain-containing protein n=1 Tax=Escallonia rubra TaxID=112253 RepID=A0AA88UFC3_9ASTE|nr:hypothetical protein RJ640_006071 [Escallonia rubra]
MSSSAAALPESLSPANSPGNSGLIGHALHGSHVSDDSPHALTDTSPTEGYCPDAWHSTDVLASEVVSAVFKATANKNHLSLVGGLGRRWADFIFGHAARAFGINLYGLFSPSTSTRSAQISQSKDKAIISDASSLAEDTKDSDLFWNFIIEGTGLLDQYGLERSSSRPNGPTNSDPTPSLAQDAVQHVDCFGQPCVVGSGPDSRGLPPPMIVVQRMFSLRLSSSSEESETTASSVQPTHFPDSRIEQCDPSQALILCSAMMGMDEFQRRMGCGRCTSGSSSESSNNGRKLLDRFGSLDDQLTELRQNVEELLALKLSVDQLNEELPAMRQALSELQGLMQQLIYAKVHFEGQAEHWFGTHTKAKGKVSWTELVRDLNSRFAQLFKESVIGKFHKLRQLGSVEQYYNEFETLRSVLVNEGCKFEEVYFVQSFISGLKDELRLEVEKFEEKKRPMLLV